MAKRNGHLRLEDLPSSRYHSGETVLLRRRQHLFALLLPLVAISLLSFLSMLVVVFGYTVFPSQIVLFTSLALVILVLTSSEFAKIIVDWYFHFYILTQHRILEISYRPFFSDKINNVILNQVKSTEIDIESNGIINKILDIGDVTITFDRPTHQEEFVFASIKNPRAVGFLLCEALDKTRPGGKNEPVVAWFTRKNKDEEEEGGGSRFRFTEEIFPGSFGAI